MARAHAGTLTRRGFLGALGSAVGWGLLGSPAQASAIDISLNLPSDGSDVTSLIVDQIQTAPDGSVIRFPAGRFLTRGTVKIVGRRDLTLTGSEDPANPTVLFRDAGGTSIDERVFWFVSCNSLIVRHLRVEGVNTSGERPGFGSYVAEWEKEHAFAFHGCSEMLMESCSVDAVYGDGVYLGGSPKGTGPCRDAVIRNVDIDRNGRQGMAVTLAENVLIENCRIHHSRRAGIDLETNGGTVAHVEIRNCYINSKLIAFPAAGKGDVSHVYIHHNTIGGSSTPWCLVRSGTRRRDWRIEYNTRPHHRAGSPRAGIEMLTVDDITIRGNQIHFKSEREMTAVLFDTCAGSLQIHDNDFTGAKDLFVAVATGTVRHSGNTWGDGWTEGNDPSGSTTTTTAGPGGHETNLDPDGLSVAAGSEPTSTTTTPPASDPTTDGSPGTTPAAEPQPGPHGSTMPAGPGASSPAPDPGQGRAPTPSPTQAATSTSAPLSHPVRSPEESAIALPAPDQGTPFRAPIDPVRGPALLVAAAAAGLLAIIRRRTHVASAAAAGSERIDGSPPRPERRPPQPEPDREVPPGGTVVRRPAPRPSAEAPQGDPASTGRSPGVPPARSRVDREAFRFASDLHRTSPNPPPSDDKVGHGKGDLPLPPDSPDG